MKPATCERLTFAELTDYTAGELRDDEAAGVEEHLFSCADCGARAAELDALVRGVAAAMRSAEVGGFMTDAVLNRLSREGVRVRQFALAPGAIVPCAVWEDDDLMVLRMHGELGDATEFTMSQRVGGTEVVRVTGTSVANAQGEILYATPARILRDLPEVDVEVSLIAHVGGEEKDAGRYTLAHGGLHRR